MAKRGQEEILGFVLVVVLLAIVFLIYLGISLRQGDSSGGENEELLQFLDSSLAFTTNCTVNDYSYKDLGALIQECRRGINCNNGMSACEIVEKTAESLIESSWVFGGNGRFKSYEFLVYELSDGGEKEQILENPPRKGPSGSNIRGADKPIGNDLIVSFEVSF